MQVIDLTTDALPWLRSDEPLPRFMEWLLSMPPKVQVGYSGLCGRPGLTPTDRLWQEGARSALAGLVKCRGSLLDLIETGRWRSFVDEGLAKADKLLGDACDGVDVIVSVGLGERNASMGYWRGRGCAFVWLEHFLEPGMGSGFLDMGASAIPIWLVHEIAHAARYSLPATQSLIPERTADASPWSFWRILEDLPLLERFLDEGLAVSFTRAALPEMSEETVLGMSQDETSWLEAHSEELLRDRMERWDLEAFSPARGWLSDCLWYSQERRTPPWSLDRPPCRWGYFVGERLLASQCDGPWFQRLASSWEQAQGLRFPRP